MILGKRNSFHRHSFFCKHSFGSNLYVYFLFSRLFILTLSKRFLIYVFLIQLIHLWISAQLVIDGLPTFLTDAPVVPFRRICQFRLFSISFIFVIFMRRCGLLPSKIDYFLEEEMQVDWNRTRVKERVKFNVLFVCSHSVWSQAWEGARLVCAEIP